VGMGIQQLDRLKDANPQDLYPALDNLNQLGAVPWVINKPILDILIQIFK
jgi:DNA-directed RNA polymerase, mitochondrial